MKLAIICAFSVPLIGDIIYTIFQIRRRYKIPDVEIITFNLSNEDAEAYWSQIKQVIRTTNGWLYLVMFFYCIYFTCGLWSIFFSLLCFLSTTNQEMVSLCSVVALISSSVTMFLNPQDKAQKARLAWYEASSLAGAFIARLSAFNDKADFTNELSQFVCKVNKISKETNL